MLMKIFAIYDAGISTWKPPMFCRAKGEILRWWTEMINSGQTDISKHPADFTLFEIGSWDDENNKFTHYKAPLSLGVALEFVKAAEAEAASQEPIRVVKKDTQQIFYTSRG